MASPGRWKPSTTWYRRNVTPVLCHTKGGAYYPLDRCGSAFIEVGLRGCCCNPAQPNDYRLKTRDVTIDFEWQGGPQKA